MTCAFGADLNERRAGLYQPGHSALTGLCNLQVIRTAEMLDISHIIFVRGKRPADEMLQIAKDSGICVLATRLTMFDSCGLLYAAGMRGSVLHG